MRTWRHAPPLALLVVLLAVGGALPARSAPVEVRATEGYARGFVDFYAGHKEIAHGELMQFPRGEEIENRLLVVFHDGSVYEEVLTFTQARFFRLRRYQLRQEGPSFPETSEVSFDDTGRYRARLKKPGKREETAEGEVDVPPDVYNGLASVLMKNLPAGETGEVHQLAFTPKPRLLDVRIVPEGDARFLIGRQDRRATRYRMVLHVSGIAGVAARLIGKDPPDVLYWIAQGPAPTFLKFEGPLYLDGPVWRAELAAPRWAR